MKVRGLRSSDHVCVGPGDGEGISLSEGQIPLEAGAILGHARLVLYAAREGDFELLLLPDSIARRSRKRDVSIVRLIRKNPAEVAFARNRSLVAIERLLV